MYKFSVENKYGEQMELTNNHRYTITEIDGLYPPDAVINTTKNANMDGSVFNSSSVNDRAITITLSINSPAEANRLLLYRYFKTKYPVRIYYKNGERDVYIDGYVSKMQVAYFEKKQTAQIEVTCPKALFTGKREQRTEFSGIVKKFNFPFAISEKGVALSEVKALEQKSIINGGDVETGVLIRLHAIGSVVNPKIYNVDDSTHMILNVEMQSGDLIVINTRTKEKTVTMTRDGKESNIIRKLERGSRWFTLLPGDNVFSYEADSFPENLQCTFVVNNQFEGV